MLQYIYDFLSILFDKLKDKDKIRNIVLFGSFARGNQRKDSDIDLFIDVTIKNKDEVSKIVNESLKEFEVKSTRTWRIKGISNILVPVVDDLSSEKWRELKRELSSYGITLYGNYQAEIKKSKHQVIIEYNLSKIKQKNKVKLLRSIYGYKLKKNRKIYTQKGILEEIKGSKISNAILVDIKDHKNVLNIFKNAKIPIKIREIWT